MSCANVVRASVSALRAATSAVHRPGVAMKSVRRILVVLVATILPLTSVSFARDGIDASPFAPVVADLLTAFFATETTCDGLADIDELCFVVPAAGASYLAQQLERVVLEHRPAGLSLGEWRAANGVWAVEL